MPIGSTALREGRARAAPWTVSDPPMRSGAVDRVRAGSANAALWLLPALALGALLRFWNLPAQVIGGDELHALRAALAMPVRQILVTYRLADNSIPLTAFDRLLMDAGVPLTEG